jgi:hypothetical protein
MNKWKKLDIEIFGTKHETPKETSLREAVEALNGLVSKIKICNIILKFEDAIGPHGLSALKRLAKEDKLVAEELAVIRKARRRL